MTTITVSKSNLIPLKNYKMALYKVHRITSYFNIMSRQFSVAAALLWQHLYQHETIVNGNQPL